MNRYYLALASSFLLTLAASNAFGGGLSDLRPHQDKNIDKPTVKQEKAAQWKHPDIPRGQALIYIVRPSRYSGSANTYRISINGTPIADLKTGFYFTHFIQPGVIRISAMTRANILNFGLSLAMMGKPAMELNTSKGEIHFIEVEVDFAGGPSLQVVDASTGESFLIKAKRTETFEEAGIKPAPENSTNDGKPKTGHGGVPYLRH
ncbi:hypothetical protein BOW34_10510 [Solemya velum gill symbiont]|uniref:DUF2846 domain-containing protein n=1 Tax=Solemya velum gill symbiont TaxID=2340 RepID=UPI0009965847|nr:DUF2846 domain-containing protein [Solemya velum gill symbiont]OOZ22216.1 hypothetical protein BOW31_11730 [Solemya velum gill symbiont]OOZ30928.1 hypothetical protein BOW34_10510 [Solemya velum gill symbiont]